MYLSWSQDIVNVSKALWYCCAWALCWKQLSPALALLSKSVVWKSKHRQMLNITTPIIYGISAGLPLFLTSTHSVGHDSMTWPQNLKSHTELKINLNGQYKAEESHFIVESLYFIGLIGVCFQWSTIHSLYNERGESMLCWVTGVLAKTMTVDSSCKILEFFL